MPLQLEDAVMYGLARQTLLEAERERDSRGQQLETAVRFKDHLKWAIAMTKQDQVCVTVVV